MSPNASRLSIGLRLSLLVTLAIALVMSLLVWLSYRQSAATFNAQSEQGLATATAVMHESLELYDRNLIENVQRLSGSLSTLLPEAQPRLDPRRRLLAGDRELPLLMAGDAPLLDGNTLLDRFTDNTGAVATVFIRDGEDFVRAATTVRNTEGERVLGTPLDRQSPAYRLMLQGLSYTGRAQLFGKNYVTHYKPLLDASGQVVAISFVGQDYTDGLAGLKQRLRSTRIGADGYFMVLATGSGDAQAAPRLLLHPELGEGDGERLAEGDGRAGLLTLASGRATQVDMEILDAQGKARVPALLSAVAFPAWDWMLVGVQPRTALLAAQQRMLGTLSVLALVAVTLIAVLVYLTVRHLVGNPLAQAGNVAAAIAAGHLDVVIRSRRLDEVGRLMQAMDSMRGDLRERIERDQRIAAENLRIRTALDSTANGALITDTAFNIIYTNPAMVDLVQRYGAQLAPALPHLDLQRPLLGQYLGVLEAGGQLPADIVRVLQAERVINHSLELDGASFQRDLARIEDDNGQLLGYVSQWRDRTVEARVEAEVAEVVAAAAAGQLDRRLSTEGRHGFHLALATQLNGLLETNNTSLDELAGLLAALSRGDLSASMSGHYQGVFARMSDAANQTVARLRGIIHGIQQASHAINTASREIAAGNDDLSRRTEQQAANLEETAASMEELTSTVRQNAEHAQRANSLAIGAGQVAREGGQVVDQVVTTMGQIEQASRRIADILSVIDGIAFQTNILALNAAVEAARAGEQGRGFAVVASEVRTLAQRSATAAREIKSLIDDSVSRVSEGSRLVGQAGRTMADVVSSVGDVNALMGEIASASQEQSSGIEQVNQTVMQMDETTQRNAALVEEVSASARAMDQQARSLEQAVAMFRL